MRTQRILRLKKGRCDFKKNIEKLFREETDVALSETQLQNEITKKLEVFENLTFENVRFRYSPNSPYVLKGITFEKNT